MKIDGACHCGTITFEAEVDPANVGVCHCTDCQTLSGAPYRASVPAPPATFRIISGEPAIYVKLSENGNKRVQAFCPKCGTPIYAGAYDNPSAPYNIRLGAIRQRGELEPKRQIWARSRQPWVNRLDSISRIEKQPG